MLVDNHGLEHPEGKVQRGLETTKGELRQNVRNGIDKGAAGKTRESELLRLRWWTSIEAKKKDALCGQTAAIKTLSIEPIDGPGEMGNS